jgi:ABC-2 type transport system permease protein
MKLSRVFAITYRLLIQYHKDFNKLASAFFWPGFDMIVFGFMIAGIPSTIQDPELTKGLLINIALWPIVNRGSLTLSLSLFEELRSQNVASLFSTPLTIGEWILGSIIEGFISSLFVALMCGGIAKSIFNISILDAGFLLVLVGFFGFLTGVAISCITTAALFIWGSRVQTIIWMAGWAFALISGIFYPIETLPFALQKAAYMFPLHYLFSNIRSFISTGQWSIETLLIGISLSIIYSIVLGALLIAAYHYSKKQGLHRLI